MHGVLCRSLLLQFGFWRVVLDEAQLVAQSSSVAAQMTSALWRRHAWVVTGTPITSRVDEIQVHQAHRADMRLAAAPGMAVHTVLCRPLSQCKEETDVMRTYTPRQDSVCLFWSSLQRSLAKAKS